MYIYRKYFLSFIELGPEQNSNVSQGGYYFIYRKEVRNWKTKTKWKMMRKVLLWWNFAEFTFFLSFLPSDLFLPDPLPVSFSVAFPVCVNVNKTLRFISNLANTTTKNSIFKWTIISDTRTNQGLWRASDIWWFDLARAKFCPSSLKKLNSLQKWSKMTKNSHSYIVELINGGNPNKINVMLEPGEVGFSSHKCWSSFVLRV